ncbi:hypothetical protein [Bacillus mycoides]|uniref:hypothetical protein n=1 Tax=Bacillus mycoides TaxID=1405 RepID=UPI0020785823|nr:hypothetical protein [Bacillus mycoides]
MFEQYVQWNGNAEFRPSEERYVNIEQGYFITIPKELVGEITIQEGSKNTQYLLYTDTDEKWLEVHTLDGKVKNYEAQSKQIYMYMQCQNNLHTKSPNFILNL